MALSKIQAESMNLADTFAFTGTVSGTPTGIDGILQVKSTKTSTQEATYSTSYVDNQIPALSITPSSTSNKILIAFSVSIYANGNCTATVFRDSTDLAGSSSYGFGYAQTNQPEVLSGIFLDDPQTTSSVTYQIKHKRNTGSIVYSQINSTTSTFTIMEIASSVLT
tara:strand:+ start:500 stop:997 length:498 start_codon:yes stop_codon:yes gene_type:complete